MLIIFGSFFYNAYSQTDSLRRRTFNQYLQSRKGFLGSIVKDIMIDTSSKENDDPQRNDVRFQPYKNKIIRNIKIERLNFGTLINDTNRKYNTFLIRLSNTVHHKTREQVIVNNLFFKSNDLVQPYKLADNERYLRDQTYLQDAKITLIPTSLYSDSVDVVVYTKDVLSIGGQLTSLDLNNTEIDLSEENIAGTGDRLSLKTFFDQTRRQNFAYGSEYIMRNIGGSFIDLYTGFKNFNASIIGTKEESFYYVDMFRPLVNSYVKWTYALQADHHETSNMYNDDSSYRFFNRYSYNNFDAWAGFNFNAQGLTRLFEGQRLRGLLGLRLFSQHFSQIPLKYKTDYDARFANISGVLASVSLFRQDFYKIKYIYGFGRNEDVPEGMNLSLTTGYTMIEKRNRPYLGLSFERYYFTAKNAYFNFLTRIESFMFHNKFEDITALVNVNYFNKLKTFGKWKQRTFLSAGFARQINNVLDQHLLLQNQYGLREFADGDIPNYMRTTIRGESVFYIPGSLASFRFAPFIFYNGVLVTPEQKRFNQSTYYSSLGVGLRIRNESLVFGTVEIKAYFFPRRNIYDADGRIDFNTDLKFKYNSDFIHRPEFIQIN